MHTGREMVLSEGTQHWVSRGEKRLLSLFDQCRSFNLFHVLPVFTSWTFYYLIPPTYVLSSFLRDTTLFVFSSFSSQKKIHTYPKVVAGRVWLGWHRGMHISVVFLVRK